MQEQLQEIEGTLARTAQRKQTILSHLHKREREQEILSKFGIRYLPTDPAQTNNVELIKYKINLLKQKIGELIATSRDANKLNIARDGEAVVRSRNDEVNRILLEKYRWELRLFNFSKGTKSKQPHYPTKKFFGCAKELPEAIKSAELQEIKSIRDVKSGNENEMFIDHNYLQFRSNYEQEIYFEVEDNSSYDSSSRSDEKQDVSQNEKAFEEDTNSHVLNYKKCIDRLCDGSKNLSTSEKRLLRIEQSKEKELRKLYIPNAEPSGSSKSGIITRLMNIEHELPSEDAIRRQLIEDRKQRILRQFDKLRNLNK